MYNKVGESVLGNMGKTIIVIDNNGGGRWLAEMLNREQMRYFRNMGILGNFGMEKRNKDPHPKMILGY